MASARAIASNSHGNQSDANGLGMRKFTSKSTTGASTNAKQDRQQYDDQDELGDIDQAQDGGGRPG